MVIQITEFCITSDYWKLIIILIKLILFLEVFYQLKYKITLLTVISEGVRQKHWAMQENCFWSRWKWFGWGHLKTMACLSEMSLNCQKIKWCNDYSEHVTILSPQPNGINFSTELNIMCNEFFYALQDEQ